MTVITDKTVVFMHIFKTGGTSVTSQITGNYDVVNEHGIMNTSLISSRHPLKIKNPRLITGHHTFGIHKYLQTDCVYFTFLRDPADRLLSAFYNLREAKAHILWLNGRLKFEKLNTKVVGLKIMKKGILDIAINLFG